MQLFLFLFLLAANGSASTDKDTIAKLQGLTLAELMEVKVITPSMREVSIQDAFGVVSTISSKEIEAFGASSLWEVLERATAVWYTFTSGIHRVSIRSGDPNTSAMRTLMLIDGRPIRTSGGNISIYNPFFAFPLKRIDRIEIIRGPGSALYGTNALEGVINIITKKDSNTDKKATLSIGSNELLQAEIQSSHQLGPWNFYGGVHYKDQEGWPYDVQIPEPINLDTSHQVFEDTLAFQGGLSFKNLEINTYGGKTKQFAEPFHFYPDLSYHSEVFMLDASYEHRLSDQFRLKTNLTNNRENFDWYINGAIPLSVHTNDYLLESTLYQEGNGNFSWLAGITYHWDSGRSTSHDAYSEEGYSLYFQSSLNLKGSIKGIVGGQYKAVRDGESAFVPRVGIIKKIDNMGIKVFFSEAFRTPIFLERFIDTPDVQLGNPDLEFEKIKSLDVQLFWNCERAQVTMTAYKNKESKLIRLLPDTEYPSYLLGRFSNSGDLKTTGLELEANYSSQANWVVQSNIAYQENQEIDGHKHPTQVPKIQAKLGLIHQTDSVHLGYFHHYHTDYQTEGATQNLFPSFGPPNASHYASLHARYQPGKRERLSFGLYVTNVWGSKHTVPDYLNSFFESLRSRAPRRAKLSVQYRF